MTERINPERSDPRGVGPKEALLLGAGRRVPPRVTSGRDLGDALAATAPRKDGTEREEDGLAIDCARARARDAAATPAGTARRAFRSAAAGACAAGGRAEGGPVAAGSHGTGRSSWWRRHRWTSPDL